MSGDAVDPGSGDIEGIVALVDLLDWRRRVFDLYRDVRDAPASEDAWRAWRDGRDHLFRTHPSSPLEPSARAVHTALPYFAYDPSARVVAALSDAPRERVEIIASHGTVGATRVAKVSFELAGAALSLDVYWLEGYAGGLFLPFRDRTSGNTTYGAGRYLLDTVKGADLGRENGGLVLDFNFAYDPSCAYDPRWGCPLAPPANRLNVAIAAGERLPADVSPGARAS